MGRSYEKQGASGSVAKGIAPMGRSYESWAYLDGGR